MDKVRSKLSVFVTVLTVVCVGLVLWLSIQVICGKNATLFGYRAYTIVTGSMEPTIAVGQTVLVKNVDPDTLEVGDIITFTSRDAAIFGYANTHRIISITKDEDGNDCFITKGDANPSEDTLYVYPSEVQGKVVFYLGASLNTFIGFLHTKLGFFLVIVCPLMIVIWWFMKDLKRQMKEYTEEAAQRQLEEEQNASKEVYDTKTEAENETDLKTDADTESIKNKEDTEEDDVEK